MQATMGLGWRRGLKLALAVAGACLGLAQAHGAGAVRTVTAESLAQEGMAEFTSTPKVWATYHDRLKDPDALGTPKKAATTVIDKVIKGQARGEVRFEWKKTIPIYNRKAYLAAQKAGVMTDEWLVGANAPAGMILDFHCAGKHNGQPYAVQFVKMTLMYPAITAVYDAANENQVFSVLPGAEIVLRGECFGKKPPKVWMEYQVGEAVRKVKLKVIKPYEYDDIVKNKLAAACMDQASAALDSAAKVLVPEKLPKGLEHGAEINLVISNGHAINVFPFQLDTK
jgi:hypothetical protein